MCTTVFVEGGFAEEYKGDLDAFLSARRDSPSIMAEWKGAYDSYIALASQGPSRISKSQRLDLTVQIKAARQKSVRVFRQSRKTVKTGYRAVLRHLYDKKHPGRIERKKLPVKTVIADGKPVEVVMLRKLPQGEWDVDFEEIQGVEASEVHEDGEMTLRANQADVKYKALTQKGQLSKEEMENAACMDDEVSEPDLQEHGADECSDCITSESGTDADTLPWAPSSLLDDDRPAPAAKSHAKGARLPIGAAPLPVKSKASAPRSKATVLKSSPRSAPLRSSASRPSACKASGSRPSGSVPTEGSAASSPIPARSSSPSPAKPKPKPKLSEPAPEDVLEKYGWLGIAKQRDEVTSLIQAGPMASFLRGDDLQAYTALASKALKLASSVHRSLVTLDIKLKKWKAPPADTVHFLAQQRSQAKAQMEALASFTGAKKKGNATRMEKALAGWVAAGLQVPLAFHVLFLSERADDLIRFGHFEDFARHVAAYVKDIDPPLEEKDVTRLQLDMVGDGLELVMQGGENPQCSQALLAECAAALLEHCPSLDPEASTDLRTLSTCLGKSAAAAARVSAGNRLKELQQQADYAGVLLPLFRLPRWEALLLEAQTASTSPCTVMERIAAAQNRVSATRDLVYTPEKKAKLYADIAALMEDYAELDDPSPTRASLARLLETIVLLSDTALETIEMHVEEALTAVIDQAAGTQSALEAQACISQCKATCEDLCLRHLYDASKPRATLSQRAQDACADDFGRIEAKLCEQHQVGANYLHVLTNVATLNRDVAVVTSDASPMNMIVLATSIGKARACMEKVPLGRSLGEMLIKIQSSCKLESAGKELFSQSMDDFKMICAELTTSVIRRAAAEAGAGSESGSEADVDKAADQLSIDAFVTKQQAHWSDTPARDRDAIDFVTETIPIISKSASKIMNLRTAVPKGYSTEVKVQEAIESVQNLEVSKPHLQFVLGDDLTERFVGAVKKMSGILKPIHEDIVKTAVQKATANIKKLQQVVIDESTPLDDDAFYKKCLNANLEAIRIERSLAKSNLDALRTCRAELPEELKLADPLVAQARFQMIRFGILAFLRRPDLSQPTDKGKYLRDQLRSIWTLHSEDQDVMAYLGTELSVKVQEAVQEAGAAAEDPGLKRPGASASTGATKKRRL